MNFFTRFFILPLGLSSVILAGPTTADQDQITSLSQALLSGQTLTADQQKQLAILSFSQLDALKAPLLSVKLTGSDKEAELAHKALTRLKKATLHQDKDSIHGATIGWYLLFDQGKLTSVPLITKIKKGSAAENAGLLAADIIDSAAGLSLRGENSRNKLVQLLAQWPQSTPLTLQIRRSKDRNPYYRSPKRQKVELRFTKG